MNFGIIWFSLELTTVSSYFEEILLCVLYKRQTDGEGTKFINKTLYKRINFMESSVDL